jgi:hypothetical protein
MSSLETHFDGIDAQVCSKMSESDQKQVKKYQT